MASANVNRKVDHLVNAMLQDLDNTQGQNRIPGFQLFSPGRGSNSELGQQANMLDSGNFSQASPLRQPARAIKGQPPVQLHSSDCGSLLPGSPLNDTTTWMSSLDKILVQNWMSPYPASPIRATVPPAEGERTATTQPYDAAEAANLDSMLHNLHLTERQQSNASEVANHLHKTPQSGTPVDQSPNGMELMPNSAEELSTNDQSWNAPVRPHYMTSTDLYALDHAARLLRNSAAVSKATCTWNGLVPPRTHQNPSYSQKVFVGGVPRNITEAGLQAAFNCFGTLEVEWPGKDGCVYLVFDMDQSVHSLLQSYAHDVSSGEYYHKMSSRSKEVQIIPWVVGDSSHVRRPVQLIDPGKTDFVGALHWMITAEMLGNIMNDTFTIVVCSGRGTFSNKSYNRAVQAAFIEVNPPKFTKIQVDLYLENAICSLCTFSQGPYFCRDRQCYRYFCQNRQCYRYFCRDRQCYRYFCRDRQCYRYFCRDRQCYRYFCRDRQCYRYFCLDRQCHCYFCLDQQCHRYFCRDRQCHRYFCRDRQCHRYFCRDRQCYRYFCCRCCSWAHNLDEIRHHKPLTRNPKDKALV